MSIGNAAREVSARRIASFIFCFLLAFSLSGCSGGRSAKESTPDVSLADTGAAEDATFSIMVKNAESAAVDSVHVFIDGKTTDGESISDDMDIPVGVDHVLDYDPGTYTFSFAAFVCADGKTAYKGANGVYTFDGKRKQVVDLPLVLDEEKMSEIAAADEAAKAQTEAEAAAATQREAEEKAAAEAAAAHAQSAAKQQPSSNGSGTVYVASSGQGKKYHMNPTCSRMKGTISMTVSEAKAVGYDPCSKCC